MHIIYSKDGSIFTVSLMFYIYLLLCVTNFIQISARKILVLLRAAGFDQLVYK